MSTPEPQNNARRWINDLTESAGEFVNTFKDIETLPITATILSADPQTQLVVLRECVERVAAMRKKLGKPRRNDPRYMNLHTEDGYPAAALQIASRLLRRNLPWSNEDIAFLVNRTADLEMTSIFCLPYLPLLVRLVQRRAETHAVTDEILTASKRLRKTLEWEDRAAERKLCAHLAALAQGPKAPAAPVGGGAAKTAQDLLDAVLKQFLPKIERPPYYRGKKLGDVASGKVLLARDPETRAEVVRVALDRLAELEPKAAAYRARPPSKFRTEEWLRLWHRRWVLLETLRSLLRRALPLREGDVVRLLKWPMEPQAPEDPDEVIPHWFPLPALTSAAENFTEANGVSASLRAALEALSRRLRQNPHHKECRKVADRLEALVTGGPPIDLEPGEAWSDAALADLEQMKAKPRKAWNALLLHCQAGGRGKPTERWREEARSLLDAVGFDALKEHVLLWFPLVDRPRTLPSERQHPLEPDSNLVLRDQLLTDAHVELLRGLVWCCGLQEDADLARAVAGLALSAYRKIPGKGPRLVSLGNACITALGLMPGLPPIGQLAVLKVKVRFGTAQKEIEKAFTAAAAREGLARDDIEELAVPSYGLEEVGLRRETLGDYQAELLVDGSTAALHWLKDGKPLKSAPAAVKKDLPEEFKELQASVKDIGTMLPAQGERIDALFLAQKAWPFAVWRERYLDHSLVGTIARRLIWSFTARGKTAAGIWHDGRLVGADGKPVNLRDDAAVSLWHPIGRPADEVLGWREWLERREVVQPFKQAHREVYLLTDAERQTGTYSNRFAAHILRQHQFNALCAARGWKNKLRLMVDDTYPPAYRLLPQWNLRAEYWVEGAGTEYGQDTNESSVYLYLSTDQVRFYRIGAAQLHAHAGGGGYRERWSQAPDEPLSLETIPPLVFSEVMRDVDLFVGVASVGNDPTWADGGPGGRYREYWQSYSFGELSATAHTRKALLARLLPRLRIADRCTLADRFLVVRGTRRTYKIHLGSGNILMEPNDQYLCIVPKQAVAGGERVFLPFEGDVRLSVILSKALLLADDAKIIDPTITSQLRR
jgi:hypothetical protein